MRKLLVLIFSVLALSLAARADVQSGLAPGAITPPFHPQHVAGPDVGSTVCPVWKYGLVPACQVWINNDDPKNVVAIMQTLQKAVEARPDHRLHAFVIGMSPTGADLQKLAAQAGVKDIGVAFVTDADAVNDYQINKAAKNTVLIYDKHKVVSRAVNFQANATSLTQLQQNLLQLP